MSRITSRTTSITAVTVAAALSLPAAAFAADGAPDLLADATPAGVLADAAPLTDAPVPQDAPEVTPTPLADADAELLADAGDPEQLLAQAPAATDHPPAPSLPRTGPELLLTLLAGGGLVLTGTGLRIGIARSRPAGPPQAAGGAR
jgi:hypothetical protein